MLFLSIEFFAIGYRYILKGAKPNWGSTLENIEKMNEGCRIDRVGHGLPTGFNKKVKLTDGGTSTAAGLDIGYFFLQETLKDLCLNGFFGQKAAGTKTTYGCFTVSRFLT